METPHSRGRHREERADEIEATGGTVYHTGEVPTFRRKREEPRVPRYGLALAIVIGLGVVIDVVAVWNWHRYGGSLHYAADAGIGVVVVLLAAMLWTAWLREERYPELLPKREFEARYPETSAAPPTGGMPFRGNCSYQEGFCTTEGHEHYPSVHQLRPDGSCGTPSHEHR